MAQASQALTRQQQGTAATDVREPPKDGQGRLGQLASEYLGERTFRQLALILGLAAAIALGVGLVMWMQEPLYRPLFSDLPAEDASAVMDALQAANIPFELEQNTGAILVPADRLYRARMTLASQGLPQTGDVGFESLREDPSFGTSRFLQTARFHRALETELGRTISSLRAVREARVHLALPERSAFVGEQRQPSGSVTVGLFAGRSLTDGQVQAIVNMVASAVPELPAERVTVVDQQGRLLSSEGESGGSDVSGEKLNYQRQLERSYVERIRSLLAPIVGAERVRAQVDARVDFTVSERTEERYDPDARAIRSEQLSSERSLRGEEAMGIPGALSNQPPGGGELGDSQQGQDAEAQGEQAQGEQNADENAQALVDTSESATRNYEVNRTVEHVQDQVGEVQRLSVAVLVDEPTTTNDEGDTVREPFSTDELAEIRSLVERAVGFDADRGDSIDVVSTRFRESPAPAVEGPPLWEQPWAWEVGRLLLAALLGLVLILAVLRPLVQGLTGRDRRGRDRTGGEEAGEGDDHTQELPGPEHAQLMAERAQHQIEEGGNEYDQKVQTAREVVSREPALAANVIKGWLGDNE
ncbi:flagellar basal-body MS-ring/collar protein FliF [Arhodomonas sp. AD133]|uniref:flagellar basal-body MS-ring/collar protein FliF n=1 Tax=Arhodomonas sp. AD133 TaxID=3415009 RepID=UPI003EBA104C